MSISPILAQFDQRIDKFIEDLISYSPLDESQKYIRHLPGSLGGLGMQSITITAPSAYKASFFSSAASMQKRFPDIYSLINFDDFDDSLDFLSKPPSQKSLCLFKNKEIHQKVLSNLSNDRAKAMFLSQSCSGTSNWLMSAASHFNSCSPLLPEQFQENLRLRLLIPLFHHFPENRHDFKCGCQVCPSDIWHCLSCPQFKGLYTNSHNLIRDKLRDLIKSVQPQASVSLEQSLIPYKNNNRRVQSPLGNGVPSFFLLLLLGGHMFQMIHFRAANFKLRLQICAATFWFHMVLITISLMYPVRTLVVSRLFLTRVMRKLMLLRI
jgi:hypothetical protein